jgi:hypothetical protein
MKTFLIIIFGLGILSCSDKTTKDNNYKSELTSQSTDSNKIEHATSWIAHVNEPYFIGDINKDKKDDSAYVNYDRIIGVDSSIQKECANIDCEVTIKFSSNIPQLIIPQSLGLNIQKTEDLNNDEANEIMLFSQWHEGYWGNIYVYSLVNSKWTELARTKAFLSEDKDWENRIIKSKDDYFLLGDGWDDSKGGLTERSIRIKIKK